MIRKLKTLLLTTILLMSFVALGNDKNDMLLGDSLFISKKYTEAFEIYKSQFDLGNASPAMALKMAFIKEGLRDDVAALYYLNTYYELTADKAVLIKMNELAEEKGLSGYEVEDRHFFQTNLLRFKNELIIFLVALSLLLLVITFRSKRKKRLAVGVPVIQVLVLVALLVVVNDWLAPNIAIINEDTLLMSGPSAAAEPIDIVDNGHKIEVLDEFDVWVKVIWEGEEAYIRKTKLLEL